MSDPGSVPHARRWLVVIVLAALAMRVPGMFQSIWFDEACMSDQRIGTWPQLLATLYVDIHPPLYVLFMHFWNGVFGDSEVSMRILPLVCGLLSLPLTFSIGRRLVGEPAALMATIMLALSPVHLWYSVEARLYAPMLLTTLVMIEVFHRIIERPNKRGLWLLHTLVMLMAAGLHYYLAVYVLLIGLLAVLHAQRIGDKVLSRRFALCHAAVLVLVALFVLVKLSFAQFETSQGYLGTLTIPDLYRFVFQWCWTGNSLSSSVESSWSIGRGIWIIYQGIGALLFVLGCRAMWRAPWSLGQISVYLLAIPGFLLVVPLLGLRNTYIERSALPSLPFVFLVISAGLLSIKTKQIRATLVSLVLGFALLSLVAYHVRDNQWTVYKQHQDWRSLAQYFGKEIDGGSGPRPVFTSMPNPRSLPYYDLRIQPVTNLEPTPEKVEQTAAKVTNRLGAQAGTYAETLMTELEAYKSSLLEGSVFKVYQLGDATLQALQLEKRCADGVFYLLQNHLHPSAKDLKVEALLSSSELERIETLSFKGLSVHKVRIR